MVKAQDEKLVVLLQRQVVCAGVLCSEEIMPLGCWVDRVERLWYGSGPSLYILVVVVSQ